uniref:DUF11 domain-containing protein n=1 Tax=Thermorudis peleae TaxID=1382356 RepID=A0A831TJC2_9BACT
MRAIRLTALLLLMVTGLGSSVAASEEPRRIAGYGYWSLRELGATRLEWRDPRPGRYTLARYTLADASQGSGRTIVVWLHYRIVLAPDTAPGELQLWDMANEWSATLVRVRVHRADDGNVFLTWNTLDLYDGVRVGAALGTTLELVVRNAVPFQWPRLGENTLQLGIDMTPGVRVSRLVVEDDSGIQVARRGPPQLSLELGLPRGPLAVGEDVTLRFRVRNSGSEPARDAVVRVDDPTGAFAVAGAPAWQAPVVEHMATGAFHLHLLKAGTFPVAVEAAARGGGGERLELRVTVGPAEGTRAVRWQWSALAAGAGLVLIGLLAGWWERRRGPLRTAAGPQR